MEPSKKDILLAITEVYPLSFETEDYSDEGVIMQNEEITFDCSDQLTCTRCQFGKEGNNYCWALDSITVDEAKDLLMEDYPERLI